MACLILLFCLYSPIPYPQIDTLYDQPVAARIVTDDWQQTATFPAMDRVNVVMFIDPKKQDHLRDLERIAFTLTEFRQHAELWIVCATSPGIDRAATGWHWISRDAAKITAILQDRYCPACVSLMIIRDGAIKFFSATVSADFLRSWLRENSKK